MSKLAEACVLSFNEWIETYPEIMPVAERSEKHEKWKKNLFDKMRNDRYHRLTSKTIKVMLVAAIICALLLSAFVFPSSRETIVEEFDIFSTFKITKDNNNRINNDIIVGYIPDGYEYTETMFIEKQVINTYYNEKRELLSITKSSSSSIVAYDNENSTSKEVYISDVKYVFCEGESGNNSLTWTKNDYVYRISGFIDYDELIRISINVK